MTARCTFVTGETIASRCSTSMIPRWASLAAIRMERPGKCGFVAEQFISDHTNIIGTAVSMSFSKDKAQSCLYVGDNANMTVYVLNRSNLQELGRLGRSGRMAGRIPLASPGEPGQQGQHLHCGSRHRQTNPEVSSLRGERLQRNRIGCRGRPHARKVVCYCGNA